MKKILALLLALMLLAIPVFAEEAAPEETAAPITPESFAGYWSALGMLVEGEIVPPTAFTEFTLKTTVTIDEDGYCMASFECVQDEGEKWTTRPEWMEDTLSFMSGFERYEDGVVAGIAYIYWTLTEEGNLSLAYEGSDGNHTIIFEPAEAPTLDNVVGVWANTGIKLSGMFFPEPRTGDLVLNEDGSAVHKDYGDGTWIQENGTIIFDIGDGYTFTYVISDNTLEYYEDEDVAYIYELQ